MKRLHCLTRWDRHDRGGGHLTSCTVTWPSAAGWPWEGWVFPCPPEARRDGTQPHPSLASRTDMTDTRPDTSGGEKCSGEVDESLKNQPNIKPGDSTKTTTADKPSRCVGSFSWVFQTPLPRHRVLPRLQPRLGLSFPSPPSLSRPFRHPTSSIILSLYMLLNPFLYTSGVLLLPLVFYFQHCPLGILHFIVKHLPGGKVKKSTALREALQDGARLSSESVNGSTKSKNKNEHKKE